MEVERDREADSVTARYLARLQLRIPFALI